MPIAALTKHAGHRARVHRLGSPNHNRLMHHHLSWLGIGYATYGVASTGAALPTRALTKMSVDSGCGRGRRRPNQVNLNDGVTQVQMKLSFLDDPLTLYVAAIFLLLIFAASYLW